MPAEDSKLVSKPIEKKKEVKEDLVEF